MARQAVLRVHADRRGRRTVLYHPESQLARHEEQTPDPPQTPMRHLLLRTTPDAAARTLAVERGLWTGLPAPTGDPGTARLELWVGDATMSLGDDELRTAVAALTR
jgi:hypothetical protein